MFAQFQLASIRDSLASKLLKVQKKQGGGWVGFFGWVTLPFYVERRRIGKQIKRFIRGGIWVWW